MRKHLTDEEFEWIFSRYIRNSPYQAAAILEEELELFEMLFGDESILVDKFILFHTQLRLVLSEIRKLEGLSISLSSKISMKKGNKERSSAMEERKEPHAETDLRPVELGHAPDAKRCPNFNCIDSDVHLHHRPGASDTSIDIYCVVCSRCGTRGPSVLHSTDSAVREWNNMTRDKNTRIYTIFPCPSPNCGSPKNVMVETRPQKFNFVYCKGCGTRGPYFDGHPIDAVAYWNDLLREASSIP